MLKLTGLKKINISIFISGTGSNLKNLIIHSFKKNSKFKITLIITNNPKAKGLNFAKKFKIEKKIINYSNIKNAEKKILLELKKNKVNLICLAGFMKILSKNFIKNFKGKIINIHPSLLPKYKGRDPINDVIKKKEKISGVTVHKLTNKFDEGEILYQEKILISSFNKGEIIKQMMPIYKLLTKKILNLHLQKDFEK